MSIVILAGGGGTRLFPMSRTNYPKQFLNINSDKSLLAQTIERHITNTKSQDVIIITGKNYYANVSIIAQKYGISKENVILEPVGRNTAPAILLAARYCKDKLKKSDNEVLLIVPADHIMCEGSHLEEKLASCIDLAKDGKIATLGIVPTKPETGYGYIKSGKPCKYGFEVNSFIEKPNMKFATQYIEEGNYYWNSGVYCLSINTFKEELEIHNQQLYELFTNNSYNEILNIFDTIEPISMDNAISEKSNNIVTIPLEVGWTDIGCWDSVYDLMEKDEHYNVKMGDCEIIDCTNSLFLSSGRLVTAAGLDNVIVIETDDVVLLSKRGESQKVKNIVEKIKHRKEIHDHTICVKPWGNYRVLLENKNYKVKEITVNSGQSLSLQIHNHRSEHWIVTAGEASVIVGEENEKILNVDQSIYIPCNTRHRLSNKGLGVVKIIEIQNGDYLGEDDIIRISDEYGREK